MVCSVGREGETLPSPVDYLDRQAGGDVVTDELEPTELLGREDGAGLGLACEPLVEALGHRAVEGRQHGLLLQGEADQGDKVGEASGLGAALDLVGRGDGEGVPQAILGLGGALVAQLLFQVLEHGLGQALLERTAVEDLQDVDLGLVGGQVIAKLAPARRPWPWRLRRSPG
jgi:hypothetical protein